MQSLPELFGGHRRLFPCPVCGQGLEVRKSKKGKPYVVCNACGMQMFVRTESGIQKLQKLVEQAQMKNIWERLADLERRYSKDCSECGKPFWVSEELIETSWFDGRFVGYRCPGPDCDGMVKPEDEE